MSKSKQTDWPVPPVSKLDAIWLDGPVPKRYWHDTGHRRLYLYWLGQRLKYRVLEDWYKVTARDFLRNRGGGLLANYWGSSPANAIKECFPNHEWYEWLFGQAPSCFWEDPRNHQSSSASVAPTTGCASRIMILLPTTAPVC